jgi:hypothetical protein
MRSIVVCASKRFREEVRLFCDDLERRGAVVYRPNINEPVFEHEQHVSPHITRTIFRGLTLEHFEMIRKADVCFVYNPGGYVGVSVTLEMGFAAALGRPIYALENVSGDPCRDVLFDRVVGSPEELLKLL